MGIIKIWNPDNGQSIFVCPVDGWNTVLVVLNIGVSDSRYRRFGPSDFTCQTQICEAQIQIGGVSPATLVFPQRVGALHQRFPRDAKETHVHEKSIQNGVCLVPSRDAKFWSSDLSQR